MSHLSTAVCSIATTQRRRFVWAAWWTAAPRHTPFRKPDAAGGGARTREQALADAERVAGRHLTLIEPYWAHAWNRMLRGEPAPPPPSARPRRPAATAAPRSAWEVLGLSRDADLAALKRAYRRRALETHPDQGGDESLFLEVQRAYERLARRLEKTRR